MRLIKNAIMNSSTPPVLDTAPSSPSSSASSATMNHEPAILVWHNNKLIYADMGTDNGTESSKDKNPEATKRLQALLAQSHLQHDKPAQKPLNASELGIMSSFKARGSQFFHSRKDAKATDHRIWTEVKINLAPQTSFKPTRVHAYLSRVSMPQSFHNQLDFRRVKTLHPLWSNLRSQEPSKDTWNFTRRQLSTKETEAHSVKS